MDKDKKEREIDLVVLFKRLWNKKKYIIVVTVCFMLFGLFIALVSTRTYTASCTFVPQTAKKNSSYLSSFAALAGINLGDMGSGEGTLSPFVYPQILENVEFQKDLMYSKVKFEEWDTPITLLDYCTNPEYEKFNLGKTILKYTIGLPFMLLDLMRGDSDSLLVVEAEGSHLPFFTKEEYNCADYLMEIISLELNEKEGYLTLDVKLPGDKEAAAQIAQIIYDLLQQYISDFKIQKAKAQMDFIQGRFDETKADFELKQLALAEFKDANRVITSATARTKLEQLTSDYNIANTIYLEMAKQLVQAGIQVKEDTPKLVAIKPVVVPYKASNSRMKVLIVWTFFGGLLSCCSVFLFDWLKKKGSNWPKKWKVETEYINENRIE